MSPTTTSDWDELSSYKYHLKSDNIRKKKINLKKYDIYIVCKFILYSNHLIIIWLKYYSLIYSDIYDVKLRW